MRAQRLRHVMGRPQDWQGLVGRVCLFPLKPAVVLFIGDRGLAFDCDARPKDIRMEGPLSTADSTDQRNGLTEHLSRRLVTQCLSWSLVQLSRDRIQLGL